MNVRRTGDEGHRRRRSRPIIDWLLQSLRVMFHDTLGAIGLVLVVFFILTALLAPYVAPYGPFEVAYNSDKSVARLLPPNARNLLGTTNQGMDVFSQLLYGSRIALLVGVLSAIGSVLVGTAVGLFSGYFGGWVDHVLMRLTDIAFGIPFLPFALIVISVTTPSVWVTIVLITLFMWRTTARVIRSQVLSLRERPFIWAARAAGASDLNILFFHIGPNVLPFSFFLRRHWGLGGCHAGGRAELYRFWGPTCLELGADAQFCLQRRSHAECMVVGVASGSLLVFVCHGCFHDHSGVRRSD